MVVALAGRRIDAEGATVGRFPLRNIERVKERIAEALARLGADELVSSAACGVDLLGLEAAAELKRHIVLPYGPEDFRRTSVTDRPGDWDPHYDRAISEARASGRLRLLGLRPGDRQAYRKAAIAVLDLAENLAAARGEVPVALVGWDGAPRDAADVTFAFLELARQRAFRAEEFSTLD